MRKDAFLRVGVTASYSYVDLYVDLILAGYDDNGDAFHLQLYKGEIETLLKLLKEMEEAK